MSPQEGDKSSGTARGPFLKLPLRESEFGVHSIDSPLPEFPLLSSAIAIAYCNRPSQMSVCGWVGEWMGRWVHLLGYVLAIFCSHLDCL